MSRGTPRGASARPDEVRWTASDLGAAVASAGATAGDTVILHVNLDALGPSARPKSSDEWFGKILASIRNVVGPDGTILVPTYTFSFCRQEPFDPGTSATAGGPWSPSADFLEFFRQQPGVVRSPDPIHSVAGQGPAAARLLRDPAPTCFGRGSVFERLVDANVLVCLIGLGLEEATLRHYSEELAAAPFRYRKLFTGRSMSDSGLRKVGWVYSVRLLADNGAPDARRLDERAQASGELVDVPLGDSSVRGIRGRTLHQLVMHMLAADPWATASGPPGDPVRLDAARVGSATTPLAVRPGASMPELIEALWRLPRDIVSDGYDTSLAVLADQVPMTVHEFPTGTECWSWLVPEKWTCHEAWLETLDGERLFSYADHPLHVVSYSLPFDGVVSRDELLAHLHAHPTLPQAIPFVFKYYERDWGLCCSNDLRDRLTDPSYRVRIRTSFSYGTLKVGEVVVPGRSPQTIVLCAHLCHPAMVNDDLTGVVVGVDVMRALLQGPTPRYTYRFLIVPETIGSLAHLSAFPDRIPDMVGGLFLEMLGREIPHALQHSFDGGSELDRCAARVMRALEPESWTTPFRSLAGNDERQFNAPGVRVPMLSLTRQLPPGHPEFPYREYHSSEDTPERVPPASLEASRDLVLAILRDFDQLDIPSPRFAGEIFCSRYGIHIDAAVDPEGNRALFDVMFLIDGTRSVSTIAATCAVPEATVERIVTMLRQRGLVHQLEPASPA